MKETINNDNKKKLCLNSKLIASVSSEAFSVYSEVIQIIMEMKLLKVRLAFSKNEDILCEKLLGYRERTLFPFSRDNLWNQSVKNQV